MISTPLCHITILTSGSQYQRVADHACHVHIHVDDFVGDYSVNLNWRASHLLYLFFFLVALGFELAKQALYHLSHSTSPICCNLY
jgi:hypothetical protein